MSDVAFLIPGDINLPTGGYAYDRQLMANTARYGHAFQHVRLPGSYPAPSAEDLAETTRIIAALPHETILLIDGLAFGAMPVETVGQIIQRVVALVHHPLCLEAGLSAERASELRQSEQLALGYAERVIVTSATTARTLEADFGVDAAKITIAEPGTARAARARGTGDPIQMLAVGSIVPRKGYDLLMHALAPLKSDRWQLTIVGAARDEAANLAFEAARDAHGLADHVRALGAVTDAALNALYDTADIFLMPSLYEGYGMVLTEALARGLPIVCTTGGAAAETVSDAAALKVPPGDAAAFGEAVNRLLDSPVLRKRMSEAAWLAADKLPSWDDTARIVATVLNRLQTEGRV